MSRNFHGGLVFGAGGAGLEVLHNDGRGVFSRGPSYGAGPGPTKFVALDANADGRLDLAVTNMLGDSFSILSGRCP